MDEVNYNKDLPDRLVFVAPAKGIDRSQTSKAAGPLTGASAMGEAVPTATQVHGHGQRKYLWGP